MFDFIFAIIALVGTAIVLLGVFFILPICSRTAGKWWWVSGIVAGANALAMGLAIFHPLIRLARKFELITFPVQTTNMAEYWFQWVVNFGWVGIGTCLSVALVAPYALAVDRLSDWWIKTEKKIEESESAKPKRKTSAPSAS